METRFNFQINYYDSRKGWDEIKPYAGFLPDRLTATIFARRLARLLNAELRMTEGNDPSKLSGLRGAAPISARITTHKSFNNRQPSARLP